MNSKISVVLPVYNVKDYIEEALTSLLEQTVKPFEIILVNDGSTDGTLQLLESKYSSEPIIKIHTQRNMGVGAAREKGLNLVRGDFVFFCDPDDFVRPDLFERFQDAVDNDPGLELFYFSRCTFVESHGERTFSRRNTATTRSGEFPTGKDLLRDLIMSGRYNASTWQYIFKREVCDRFQVRFGGRAHEDHCFSMSIYMNATHSFATTDNMYFQRVRKGSLTQSVKDAGFVHGGYYAYLDTLAVFKAKVHEMDGGRQAILNFMERNISATVVKCLKNNVPLPKDFYKVIRRNARECGVLFNARMAIAAPEVFFALKKVRFTLRRASRKYRGR